MAFLGVSDCVDGLETLVRRLRSRQISSEELTREFLRRIETSRDINAVVEVDAGRAIQSAREADRRLRLGVRSAGKLCGIPITVKRTFRVRGFTHFDEDVDPGTPAGCPATKDATAVARLRASGAIILGRTNAPPRAADIDTWSPRYGRTAHPADLRLSPGGSSGGSAAAVAAGQTVFDLASDDAGSARIPAHACGVFALRPSLGRISSFGHVPGPLAEFDSPDMLAVSPIARSAGDLRFIWQVLGPGDGSPPRASPPAGPIGAVLFSESAPVSSEVASCLGAAVDKLRAAGYAIEDADLPVDLAENWLICQKLLAAEDERGQDASELTLPVPDVTAEPIEVVLWSSGMSHRAWLQLRRRRADLRSRWQRFFGRYMALIVPVIAVTALPVRHQGVPFIADEISVGGVDVPLFSLSAWCALASVAGLPALSMPVKRAPGQLPVGLQLIGADRQEAELIDLARRFSRVLGQGGAHELS